MALKWEQMKGKSTSRIPPDLDSFKLHVARVNYQTYIYLAFDKPDVPQQPTGHGWTLQNGMCVPLRFTEEALPRSLHASLHPELQELRADLSDTGNESDYNSDLSDQDELD